VHHGDYVYMFGTGQTYRGSNVYLARIRSKSGVAFPNNGLWTFTNSIEYFMGMTGNKPTWWSVENDPSHPLKEVVVDNPTVPVQPPGWKSGPTVGNVSVQYLVKEKLWVMTYDGGRQEDTIGDPDHILGIYYSFAKDPWGPWSPPQIIYNPAVDGGFGNYIANPPKVLDPKGNLVPNPYAATALVGGPLGPMIGQSNPCYTRGAVYAPFMIHRFNRLNNGMLSIYYTMSTWNPYTVLLMRSDFAYTP
jgi:hypothetical protein